MVFLIGNSFADPVDYSYYIGYASWAPAMNYLCRNILPSHSHVGPARRVDIRKYYPFDEDPSREYWCVRDDQSITLRVRRTV